MMTTEKILAGTDIIPPNETEIEGLTGISIVNEKDAIRTAHCAAALSVMKLGAQSSITWREETDYFLGNSL